MVSEFLGQLSLNVSVMLHLYIYKSFMMKPRIVFHILCTYHTACLYAVFTLSLICFDSSGPWTQVPHRGACCGLWPWQRCSQTWDRNQNQRQDTRNAFLPKSQCNGCSGSATTRSRWVDGICESAPRLKMLDNDVNASVSVPGGAVLRPLTERYWQQSDCWLLTSPPFCCYEECVLCGVLFCFG